MRKFSNQWIVFSMEVNRFLQNRKQLLLSFFVPVLVVVALLFGISMLEKDAAAGEVKLYGADAFREVLCERFPEIICTFHEEAFASEASLPEKKNVAVVRVLQEEIRIYYRSSMITNPAVPDLARQLAESILALQAGEAADSDYRKTVTAIRMVDMARPEDYLENTGLPLVSMIFMVVFLLTNASVSGLTTETLSGERENGSLDLLLLSGTPVKTILLEKYLFAVLYTYALLLVQGAALLVGIRFVQPQLYRAAFFLQGNTVAAWAIPVLFCLFAVAILVPALFLAIAASFEKKKQAASYMGIVQIVMAMFTYLPNVFGKELLNYLPISNLSGILFAALTGRPTAAFLCGCLGVSVMTAVLSLCYATIVSERKMTK